MYLKRAVIIIALTILCWSCKNDDNGGVVEVPPRLLSEVSVENDMVIREFLQTHFYNYEEFENPESDFDFKIVFDTLAGDNAGKIPLIDQVDSEVIQVSSSFFGLSAGEIDVNHTLYYFIAREGIGENPTVADSTFVQYEGTLLDGRLFDGVTSTGTWFDLPGTRTPNNPGLLVGVINGIVQFKSGGEITDNGDGTFGVDGFGVGAIFMPSGLGYFQNQQSNIPPYSPLIFKINLLITNEADHDRDGIPSIMEDLDGDGNVKNDNTDSAAEESLNVFIPNYLDADDDNDGTPTRDEILIDGQGNISFPDTDGDGIPDYLDSDS